MSAKLKVPHSSHMRKGSSLARSKVHKNHRRKYLRTIEARVGLVQTGRIEYMSRMSSIQHHRLLRRFLSNSKKVSNRKMRRRIHSSAGKVFPTDCFRTSEPRVPAFGKFYVAQKCQFADFEAQKTGNVRSGHTHSTLNRHVLFSQILLISTSFHRVLGNRLGC